MKKTINLLLLLACSIPLTVSSAVAPPAPVSRPSQAAQAPSPAAQLRTAVDSLRSFLNQEPAPPAAAVATFLDQYIAPLFDFQTMARSAGGRFYETLNPQQRAAMANEIKELFLTRLSQALASYQGQQVRFLRPRISPQRNEATVSMMIINAGSYPTRIDFRLGFRGNDWRIIDLAANGSSAVVYYRHMLFAELMRRGYGQTGGYSPYRPRW